MNNFQKNDELISIDYLNQELEKCLDLNYKLLKESEESTSNLLELNKKELSLKNTLHQLENLIELKNISFKKEINEDLGKHYLKLFEGCFGLKIQENKILPIEFTTNFETLNSDVKQKFKLMEKSSSVLKKNLDVDINEYVIGKKFKAKFGREVIVEFPKNKTEKYSGIIPDETLINLLTNLNN